MKLFTGLGILFLALTTCSAGQSPTPTSAQIGYKIGSRWKIYGMELPDPVLEKIYHRNAERIFSQCQRGCGGQGGRNDISKVGECFFGLNSLCADSYSAPSCGSGRVPAEFKDHLLLEVSK